MLCETPNVRLDAQYRIATLSVDWSGELRATLEDLDAALRCVQGQPVFEILILRGFDAGFGDNFDALADDDTAELGQRVARRLAAVEAITIAKIDGPCLGGALELALACDYRAAAGRSETRLGFPQVRSGCAPCWGGTVRLTRRAGLNNALELLLSGRRLSAAQALEVGLIDRAFGPRLASVHFDSFVLDIQRRGRKPRVRPPVADRLPWRRERLLRQARAGLRQTTSEDHAAAWAILRVVADGVRHGRAEGFAAERRTAKRLTAAPRIVAALSADKPALPFPNIAIVGGGTIGASWAQWASLRGHAVVVRDRDPAAARTRLARQFELAVAQRLIGGGDAEGKLNGIACTNMWDGVAAADLVIEAIDESQSRKRAVLREIDQVMRPSALLATSSTILTVQSLGEAVVHPERLFGLHLGHPAATTRLVELTAGPATGPHVIGRVRSWLRVNGKTGVQTADRPGRVLGRVLLPYLHEAVILATEGYGVAAIDAAMRRFGMSWGPFEAMDAAGLDTIRSSLRGMTAAYGRERRRPPCSNGSWLAVTSAKKSESGFYRHAIAETPVNSAALPRPKKRRETLDGVHRLVARLLNGAFAALGSELANAAAIDGIALASGWPAFRGGPLYYAGERGIRKLVRELRGWQSQCGSRFAPCAELLRQSQQPRQIAA